MKLSDAFDVLARMSTVKRYSQTTLINPESVLEHTGFVALLAYIIADDTDKYEALSKALVHDVDEIITGDIPRPTKYYNAGVSEALDKIADDNMQIIAKKIEPCCMYNHWRTAKDDKSGFIVELCDKLAVVYKLYQEVVMHGNKTLIGHAGLVENALNEMINAYPELNNYIYDGMAICQEVIEYE